jgi:hypothetical protein
MTDDTQVQEFLERMANEIEVSSVDPRGPAHRARRRRTAAKAIVLVVAVVAIVSAGSWGLRSITGSSLGPAGEPSPSLTTISGMVFGPGNPGFTVQAPPGWSSPDEFGVTKGDSEPLGISVWNVARVPRNPCHWKGTLYNPGRSVDDLVGALRATPMRTATPPTDVTLDGYDGRFLTWTVAAGLTVSGDADFHGCDDPGNGHQDFVSWKTSLQGEQYAHVDGQVDLLWILNVRGERLVVDASYGPDTPLADRDELTRIAESLHFSDQG